MNHKVKIFIDSIKNKNIHIIGASGNEGATIIEFLFDNQIKNITAHDFQESLGEFRKKFKQVHPALNGKERSDLLKKIINPRIKLNLKNEYLKDIEKADLVFLTQAWYMYPPNLPKINKIIAGGTEISSLTKLYLELTPCPIIGITGSQGKSTTTALITHILKTAGEKVYTSGNIRDIYQQLLPNIKNIKRKDIIVLEISNRQLSIDLKKSPDIAVITTIVPNHIEEHGSYQKYQKIKQSILKYQKRTDIAILNYDNTITRNLTNKTKGITKFFSTKKILNQDFYIKNGVIYSDNKPLLKLDQIQTRGPHNISNTMAAIAATAGFNIELKNLKTAIKTFEGIPHRLQKICTINHVEYYDDLKSTTPTATKTAIESFPKKKIHLIVGGYHKNTPYAQLAKTINKQVETIYTMPGTTTDLLIMELKKLKSKVIIYQHDDIKDLVKRVREQAKPHHIVLLSPAGAYFQRDHLKNKYSFKYLLKQD